MSESETYVVILARGRSADPWAMRNRCGALNASYREADKRAQLIAAVKTTAAGWAQIEPATSFAVAEVRYQGVRHATWTVQRFLTGPFQTPEGLRIADAGPAPGTGGESPDARDIPAGSTPIQESPSNRDVREARPPSAAGIGQSTDGEACGRDAPQGNPGPAQARAEPAAGERREPAGHEGRREKPAGTDAPYASVAAASAGADRKDAP